MTSAQRFRFWAIGLAAFLVTLYVLRGMLLPFVAGMAIAYFLDPLADRLERVGLSRMAATALITGVFFSLGVLLVVLLVPVIEEQVLAFVHRVPDYVDSLSQRLEPYIRDIKRRLSPRDIERLRSSVGEYAGTAAAWVLQVAKSVLTGGFAIVNVVMLLFITPVVTFYLLRDWDCMVAKVDHWLPRDHADTIRTQLKEINRTLSGFIRGQALVCLFLATFYGLGLTLVGIDLGLVIGLASGALSFVPYLGTLSGLVVSVAVGIAQDPDLTLPALAAGVFVVGNVIEGNFLTPKLVGDKVGLHPVWVMFALLAGGALFGFVGLIVAVPVAAVIGVLARFALVRYLQSPLYRGHE
ncbi:MAG: AI-2E family transporter [Magnetospirillum sp.]|nr:AI-2E family transporter [Magnetospirillum sp.]